MKIVIDIPEKDYGFIKSVRSIMKNSDTFERLATDLFLSVKNGTSIEPEITNDDLQAAMTESYHLGYELAETKFKKPQGKWLITKAYPRKVYCSECCKTYAQEKWEVWQDGSLPRNYCPNCGADMRNKGE